MLMWYRDKIGWEGILKEKEINKTYNFNMNQIIIKKWYKLGKNQ